VLIEITTLSLLDLLQDVGVLGLTEYATQSLGSGFGVVLPLHNHTPTTSLPVGSSNPLDLIQSFRAPTGPAVIALSILGRRVEGPRRRRSVGGGYWGEYSATVVHLGEVQLIVVKCRRS